MQKVLVVVGAGPGLGAAIARRFGQEGYAVELVARGGEALGQLSAELHDEGIDSAWTAVDIGDTEAFGKALEQLAHRRKRVDVLHFNPSVFRLADPLHLAPSELLADVNVGVAALLTAVQATRALLHPGSRITATGSLAADEPWHEACCLGVQKAALRNLVLSLDRTLLADGIRAASMTVNGTLAPDTAFSPDRVADALFKVASTPEDRWHPEVPYGG